MGNWLKLGLLHLRLRLRLVGTNTLLVRIRRLRWMVCGGWMALILIRKVLLVMRVITRFNGPRRTTNAECTTAEINDEIGNNLAEHDREPDLDGARYTIGDGDTFVVGYAVDVVTAEVPNYAGTSTASGEWMLPKDGDYVSPLSSVVASVISALPAEGKDGDWAEPTTGKILDGPITDTMLDEPSLRRWLTRTGVDAYCGTG